MKRRRVAIAIFFLLVVGLTLATALDPDRRILGQIRREPFFQRKAGSVWPTPQGMAVSKDVWMLGIGLGLLADAASRESASQSAAN